MQRKRKWNRAFVYLVFPVWLPMTIGLIVGLVCVLIASEYDFTASDQDVQVGFIAAPIIAFSAGLFAQLMIGLPSIYILRRIRSNTLASYIIIGVIGASIVAGGLAYGLLGHRFSDGWYEITVFFALFVWLPIVVGYFMMYWYTCGVVHKVGQAEFGSEAESINENPTE